MSTEKNKLKVKESLGIDGMIQVDLESYLGRILPDAIRKYLFYRSRYPADFIQNEDTFCAKFLSIGRNDFMDTKNEEGGFMKLIKLMQDNWEVVSVENVFECDYVNVVLGKEMVDK